MEETVQRENEHGDENEKNEEAFLEGRQALMGKKVLKSCLIVIFIDFN
jgi:hypothetical protein